MCINPKFLAVAALLHLFTAFGSKDMNAISGKSCAINSHTHSLIQAFADFIQPAVEKCMESSDIDEFIDCAINLLFKHARSDEDVKHFRQIFQLLTQSEADGTALPSKNDLVKPSGKSETFKCACMDSIESKDEL